MAAGEPAEGHVRPTSVTETLMAGAGIGTAPAKLEMTAEEAVTQLYMSHYRPLVRLAVLLVRDEPTAEEVVQECFIAMHDGWHRLRDEDKALSCLELAMMNRSAGVLGGRGVIDPRRARIRAGHARRRAGGDLAAGVAARSSPRCAGCRTGSGRR